MSEDLVNVEVDGVALKAKKGAMIIQVTDASDAYVPRFCYHEKLPIAASCRMCLVEVEKAPKPMPACATPVAEGMKIFTKSPRALAAQKATMEFLLINHPLDCPICDQGGECELQDLSMGYGRDIARFAERKRVVKDKNIGPLISTDMTRCIHCTRCVRFGQDIAGIRELGTTGRGEWMRIDTFIERSVDHELSGNIIDLCPVGALNSKPFRFRARGWEMTQTPLVSPHDGAGSNLFGHVLRGRLMRVVPRVNEAVNETWISDRDRFSYEGVYSADRLTTPMLREGAEWRAVSWEAALEATANGLRRAQGSLGVLASPSGTVEELYLLNRLVRGLGSHNIDHRLRQSDFRDQQADPAYPSLGAPIATVEQLDSLFIIGSNLRREIPILAHRVRKAALRGARVSLLNPARFEYLFPVSTCLEAAPARQVPELAGVLGAALAAAGTAPTAELAALVRSTPVTADHKAVAAQLASGERRAIWLGALALRHPAYADLRALAAALAAATGATLGILAEGANAAGAYLAGAVPHRDAGGAVPSISGLTAREMLEQPLSAYLLAGGVEPRQDSVCGEAGKSLAAAAFVVAATPYMSAEIRDVAHVLLPIGTFAETSGTYVNLEGRWQSVPGAARPVGESRPGWKVYRVLCNLLGIAGSEYQSSEEVLDEMRRVCGEGLVAGPYRGTHRIVTPDGPATVLDVPMYQIDALVRRAPSLQRTRDGRAAAVTY
ncbi:MAG TPA: NADH-quinone oxidoreductase subunit NuoG [Steroidobacteraceae bacterium]|nr:NADH-quinone oxidoreductase subunit NuoG [Steroidobacteraceae bacterium]HQX77309.1 NADH-quinone oxidoreductase subunit NuoG [Steroidobacteraceae bacterium]HQZ79736.1 NADH-quinone oxidoreductase subunit NuoG [Steroidobacteraceae bacterium]